MASPAPRSVEPVTTSNAEQNTAMRHINRELGFEPIEHVILARPL